MAPSVRTTVWEWAQTALLAANLVWTTVCLGGYLAQTMIVTSALTGALLMVHGAGLLLGWEGASGPSPDGAPRASIHPASWFVLPFLLYAAGNTLWLSPVKWLGWFDWFGWAQMSAVFWVVLNGMRSRTQRLALLGTLFFLALLGVILAAYQRFVRPDWLMLGRTQADQYLARSSGFFGIPNSLAALLLLLLPIAGALTFRRGAAATTRILFGWLTLLMLFGLGLTISRGAWIGLAIALVTWPLISPALSLRRRLLIAAGVSVAIALGSVALYLGSASVRERLDRLVLDAGERSRPILWRAAWQMFRDHPVAGAGSGSYSARFEKYRPEGFLLDPKWAHNDYLNTLSDYGAIGFALFFGAAGAIGWRCFRGGWWLGDRAFDGEQPSGRAPRASDFRIPGIRARNSSRVFGDRLVRQGLGIGLLAFSLQLFVDFHFKLAALAMAFAAVAGLAVRATWRTERRVTGQRAWSWPVVGIVCCTGGLFVILAMTPRYRAEGLREQARRKIDRLADVAATAGQFRADVEQAERWLVTAVALDPANARAWSDLAYALAQWSRTDREKTAALGKRAQAAAENAVRLAPLIAEFHVRLGVAKDLQLKWSDAGTDFTRAMSLSPKAVLPWYHYAFHLSLRRGNEPLADAMLGFCLRLDPQNRQAIALRQRLAPSPTRP